MIFESVKSRDNYLLLLHIQMENSKFCQKMTVPFTEVPVALVISDQKKVLQYTFL